MTQFTYIVEHPDDEAVALFSFAMKHKMKECRERGKAGWDDPKVCSINDLKEMFLAEIAYENPKIDLVDVANFAMMLHQRGVTHV